MCESVVTPNTLRQGVETMKFSDQSGLLTPVDNDVLMHGYDAFPLGGVDSACFCGWLKNTVGQCIIPTDLCKHKNLTGHDCFYMCGSMEGHVFTQALVDDWSGKGDWDCAENDFSDSWGIVPRDFAHDWIITSRDIEVNMADLLSFGMAGLRIGNMATLPEQAKIQGVHPGNTLGYLILFL